MSQPIVINIGALPNDGTGDPLRTAFNEVNLNFANVFASGPVGSNIQIANNIVSTLNTNGNLVLSPNGVGVVQANASIVPNLANIRNLGSATQRWATVYGQYLNISSGTTIAGDLSVAGNLTVSGNIVEMGNIVTDSLTIQLGNTVSNSAGADGAGITVGASDDIATILYNSTDNEWNTNIGISAVGNVSAGNVLTSAEVIANGEIQSGTGFFTGGYLSVNGSTDLANVDVSGNLSAVGNITANAFIGDGSQLTNLPLATNFTVGVMALGNGFTLNGSNQVTTSSLYNTNLTQPTQHYALSVDTNGVVILPDQSIINGSTLRAVAGSYAGLTTNDGENSWMWVDSTGAYIATQYNESGNSHQWTFDNTGNLTLPANTFAVNYANGDPVVFGGSTGNLAIIGTTIVIDAGAPETSVYISPSGESYAYLELPNNDTANTVDTHLWNAAGNVEIGAGNASNFGPVYSWKFNNAGSTIFPTLTTQRGDNPSGTIQGQTLLFGDNTKEAIITTPNGVAGNEYSQRLVINPGAGYDYGEGGDIYLWAGRGGDNNGSGGDIKIRGGQGMADGTGGYIRMEAGDSQANGQAGYIDITGGQGGNTTGGYVNVTGGYGATTGGDVKIYGGYGQATGGNVNIWGGASGNGQINEGHVNIQTGGNTWTFDNTGNLNVPQGGYIGAAGVKGDGTMLTGGAGNVASLTSFYANGFYAGCFTANPDGNVNITTYTGNGIAGQWTFDTTGNLTVPGNIIMTTGIVGSNASPAPYLSGFDIVSAITLSASGNVTGAYVKGNGSELTNLPAPTVTQDITSNGAMSIMTYDGNIKYVNYATVEPATGNIAGGNISATGNVTGGNIVTSGNITTAGSGGDITLTGGNITGAGNISAGNVSATGNITAANFIGNTFSLAQTILPTIQSIVISNTSSEYETSGGSGYANVLVANVAPVIEYGVIVTAGSTVDKYVTGNLANIPGTEKIMISTGTSDQPFTVYSYVTTNAGTYYSASAVGFSGLCLLKGTMISLADGTYKPIEDINNGDLLLTWDFDLGQYAQARPLWIKRVETGTRYNQLTFSDGTVLRTFDQHRIFNKQAGAFTYPMSDDTPIGTITVNEHGQEITLVKREIVWDTIEHYNIITDHHINLFADSILTSCRFNNIYPITDMKFVKDTVLNRNLSEFAEIESRFVSGLRLQEQSFELAMIEGYVNRLLATEATELIGVQVKQ